MSEDPSPIHEGLPWPVAVLVFTSILALAAIGISLVSINSLSTRHDDNALVITASALQTATEVRLQGYQQELEQLLSDELILRDLRTSNFERFAKSQVFRSDVADVLWISPTLEVTSSWSGPERRTISPELKAAFETSLSSGASSFSKPWAPLSDLNPDDQNRLALVEPIIQNEDVIGLVGLIIDVEAFFAHLIEGATSAQYTMTMHHGFTPKVVGSNHIISRQIYLPGQTLQLTISRNHHTDLFSILVISGLAVLALALCVFAFLHITNRQRRHAEAGWVESSGRYERIFEIVDTPILEYDLHLAMKDLETLKSEGITDFDRYFAANPNEGERLAARSKVLSANRAALELFGAKSERQLLEEFPNLFTQDAIDRFNDVYSRIANNEAFSQEQVDMKRLDGSIRSVLLSFPVPGNFNQAQIVPISFVDQTEQKLASETLLLATKTAEQANLAKTNFLTTMSHELRTPLNGILGMSQLLMSSDLTGPQREFATYIHQSGGDLLVVLNDILDLSQIESGKFDIIEDEFRFDEIIAPLEKMWRQQTFDKGIDFTAEYHIDLSSTFVGDGSRLRQVLSNLLSNACKFTNHGGVHFSISQSTSSDGPIIRFQVQDTGIGIPEQARKAIFEKFVQADSSNARQHNGTGLGLAICKGIADLMGGKIGFESSPGEGSMFWLELDAQTASNSVQTPSQTANVHADTIAKLQLNLLIATAVSDQLNKLTPALSQAGITFDVAENGIDAVRLVKANRYDAVLIDPNLKELDGIATAQVIRTLPHGRAKMPIIALTNDARTEDQETYLRSGMAACLSSPIDPQDLFVMILKLLANPDIGRSFKITDQRQA